MGYVRDNNKTGLDEIISELELITNSKNTIVSVLKIKSAELQLI
jgi:hypothetical protein